MRRRGAHEDQGGDAVLDVVTGGAGLVAGDEAREARGAVAEVQRRDDQHCGEHEAALVEHGASFGSGGQEDGPEDRAAVTQ